MASQKRDLSEGPEGPDGQGGSGQSARAPKRSRKAVNCEPCRASKLKCDRKRPCSGCEIRGTTDQCYPEETALAAKDDPALSFLEIRGEIERIQSLLRMLEAALPRPADSASGHKDSGIDKSGIYDAFSDGAPHAAWERFSQQAKMRLEPLYVGPSAAPAALLLGRSEKLGFPGPLLSHDPPEILDKSECNALLQEYYSLPNHEVLFEHLIHFFFESCTFFMAMLNQNLWLEEWRLERARGDKSNILTLGTVYLIAAIALSHLPENDPIGGLLPKELNVNELGQRWYAASRRCIAQYRSLRAPPSLPYVEHLLLRCHYLYISQTIPTGSWAGKGDLNAAVLALALHRDPGNWKISPVEIERRRWAWWNFVSLDRWQAFVFGRPLSVQSHHFDTKFPISEPPQTSPSPFAPPPFDPNTSYHLAKFRLIVILGDILRDALSTRPEGISFEAVKAHDQSLDQWKNSLPFDLRLDDVNMLSRGLMATSPLAIRKIMLQSVWLRTISCHVRFSLHQQYTVPRLCPELHASAGEHGKMNLSLATMEGLQATIHAANTVIDVLRELVSACYSNVFIAQPGYISWSENALFSAAMFYADLLIAKPDQPSREMYRERIRNATTSLNSIERFIPHAGQGRIVLSAIAPLYNDTLDETTRGEEIEVVRRLTFPSLDCSMINLQVQLAQVPIAALTSATGSPQSARKKIGMASPTSTKGASPGELAPHAYAPVSPASPIEGRGSSRASLLSSTIVGEEKDATEASLASKFEGSEYAVPPFVSAAGMTYESSMHPMMPSFSGVPLSQTLSSSHASSFSSPSNVSQSYPDGPPMGQIPEFASEQSLPPSSIPVQSAQSAGQSSHSSSSPATDTLFGSQPQSNPQPLPDQYPMGAFSMQAQQPPQFGAYSNPSHSSYDSTSSPKNSLPYGIPQSSQPFFQQEPNPGHNPSYATQIPSHPSQTSIPQFFPSNHELPPPTETGRFQPHTVSAGPMPAFLSGLPVGGSTQPPNQGPPSQTHSQGQMPGYGDGQRSWPSQQPQPAYSGWA
ncbi:hypothetical protein DL93DRAFT_2100582 [Clavulina sp. PMI_390]|nr:hypothetical protein DL93DRAFT_2100582 [Clavulina sp. PMI_390]